MKSSLIWDGMVEKPAVGFTMRNKAAHIHHLEELPGLNAGLRQLRQEKPELVFLAADFRRPDYSALMRTVRHLIPQSYLIALEDRAVHSPQSSALPDGPNLVLPILFTEKELLDGIFLAELQQANVPITETLPPSPAIPTPEEFLAELTQSRHKLPEQVWTQHWQKLVQRLEQAPNDVGWHLVGLSALIEEAATTRDGCPPAVNQARAECLRAVAASPPGPIWQAAFEKLCSAYISCLSAGADASNPQIVRIRQFIDEHIEEELSLKRVAQEFYLSTSYLSRLFKSQMGTNFSDYISMRRIEQAKALLTETDLSVAEISQRFHYPEQNSFSRFFKSKVGIPPLTYRALNKGTAKERRAAAPEPVLEDFEITDFGPCAFTSEDLSFAYSFHRRQ